LQCIFWMRHYNLVVRKLWFLNIFISENVYLIYLLFFPFCNNLIYSYVKRSPWKWAAMSNPLLICIVRFNVAMGYKLRSSGGQQQTV
jgi:hypothetical protein